MCKRSNAFSRPVLIIRGLDLRSHEPLWSFEGACACPRSQLYTVSGGYGEGETPLPIPNREVKPLSADGTWPARARESRTPPVLSRCVGPSACSRPRDMKRGRSDGARPRLAPPHLLLGGAGRSAR